MIERKDNLRDQMEIISADNIVPENHLLRKIEKAVNFDKIYEFVKDLYCDDNVCPGIDPVMLFKMVLVQHLYGIRSLRRTAEEVSMNIAYRWFLGYGLNETTPHFSYDNIVYRLYEDIVYTKRYDRNLMTNSSISDEIYKI